MRLVYNETVWNMSWKTDSKDQVYHLNWKLFLFKSSITTEPFMPWSDPLSQFNAQEYLQAQAVSLTDAFFSSTAEHHTEWKINNWEDTWP